MDYISESHPDFSFMAMVMHRLSPFNSNPDCVMNGQYFDLKAIRLILQTGSVQPSLLIGVPFLQAHNVSEYTVEGYVTIEHVKTIR